MPSSLSSSTTAAPLVFNGQVDRLLQGSHWASAGRPADFALRKQTSGGDPGIEHRHAHRLEIGDVAGDDCQPVDRSRRSNQCITFGARMRDMEASILQGHGCIDGEDAPLKVPRI